MYLLVERPMVDGLLGIIFSINTCSSFSLFSHVRICLICGMHVYALLQLSANTMVLCTRKWKQSEETKYTTILNTTMLLIVQFFIHILNAVLNCMQQVWRNMQWHYNLITKWLIQQYLLSVQLDTLQGSSPIITAAFEYYYSL